MPNKPRPENRHRMVRVEDELWEAAKVAAAALGTTRAEAMRAGLRQLVQAYQPQPEPQFQWRAAGDREWHDGVMTATGDVVEVRHRSTDVPAFSEDF